MSHQPGCNIFHVSGPCRIPEGVAINPTSQQLVDQELIANAIRLAREHKRHCAGSDCGIQLYYIRMLFERAGIPLTPEQIGEFI